MKRRDFLTISSVTVLALVAEPRAFAASASREATRWREARKFAELPFTRVAYVEKGEGAAALFFHGFSLNGYQWRGALDRLHPHRRCIAPDLMSMGWTETPIGREISPGTQVTMLGQLLDKLQIDAVDLVASDSGPAFPREISHARSDAAPDQLRRGRKQPAASVPAVPREGQSGNDGG
jgi:haloalkane dehalogenase